VTKILSLRLKKILHKVIDVRSQLSWKVGVDGQHFRSNEAPKEVKKRKISCIFLKVYYEKTYVLVIWDFIYYMMNRLGFWGKWIEWVRACLESSSVYVLVNKSSTKKFRLRKELRQEDPLAPFLFLIVVEGLAGVVRMAVEKEMLESLEVGDRAIKVNMLQYADDTLFFLQSESEKRVCNQRNS